IIRIHKTPISAGVVGFRLPKNTDPDMPALEVISNLLTNNASSGSIDNLINDRKLMMAGLMYMPYMDGGTAFLYFVPKPVIQTLKRAEKMALKCLDDIKDGKFSDEDLVAVKTNRMKHLQLSYESNGGAAGNLIDAYIKGVAPNAREKEVEAIQQLTREDIQRVAKKYFGENSLAMYSRMGYFNGKPEKLKKPPFKPVVPKNETHSAYYNEWKKINADKANPKFIDFANEIDSIPVAANNWILKNKNPFNNIVSMNLVFGTGKHYIPVLDFTDSYLMNCGTTSTPIKEFNKKLYALGCTFTVDAGAHQFAVKLSFPEDNLQNVLLLIGDLLEHPAYDKKAMKKIHDEIRGEKYMDTRSPDYWSDALLAYAIYGKQSAYLDRMTYQELKIKGIPGILQSVAELKKASLKVVYTGNINNTTLINALANAGFNTTRNNPQPIYFPTKREYKQPVVYVVNTRKARQSQVEIIKIGDPYNKTDLPNISAFNKYFGGDMSSIMFQEVREFRSLAYSTSGSYYFPTQTGNKGVFIASAGTQSDKTLDCVEIMHKIANEMPLHSERMDAVRNSLMEQGSLARPSFRNVISYIETWKRRGFNDDPVKTNFERYSKMSFDDLVGFYDQAIKTKPTITCVTGRVKSFDVDELKKYGKIEVINKYSLVKQ
ncbi:MAG TPA: insulinase family protein, partial [Flavobacteriales bacterium]|nr:insulinase family protein [Flavobacteriales bacterium]